MPGIEVTQYQIDLKASETVKGIRDALLKIETTSKWLAKNPKVQGQDDILTVKGFYTPEEAAAYRVYFARLETFRHDPVLLELLDDGRVYTGLE